MGTEICKILGTKKNGDPVYALGNKNTFIVGSSYTCKRYYYMLQNLPIPDSNYFVVSLDGDKELLIDSLSKDYDVAYFDLENPESSTGYLEFSKYAEEEWALLKDHLEKYSEPFASNSGKKRVSISDFLTDKKKAIVIKVGANNPDGVLVASIISALLFKALLNRDYPSKDPYVKLIFDDFLPKPECRMYDLLPIVRQYQFSVDVIAPNIEYISEDADVRAMVLPCFDNWIFMENRHTGTVSYFARMLANEKPKFSFRKILEGERIAQLESKLLKMNPNTCLIFRFGEKPLSIPIKEEFTAYTK